VSHLYTWGCTTFFHVPKTDWDKSGSKTIKCSFVGYDEQTKAYMVYLPEKQKVDISRDVALDEEKLGLEHIKQIDRVD
jgi:hypothetical protein